MFLSAAYAKQRSNLRKKNDAEKKTLKDAMSRYNRFVGYCSSTSGHTSVTESDVLARNVLWESYEGDNDFVAYSCNKGLHFIGGIILWPNFSYRRRRSTYT